MYIMLVIALLLTPGDSLSLVERCQQEEGLITKVEVCQVALMQIKNTDSLFIEIALSEIQPTLDTLVAYRDSVDALLIDSGVGRYRRYVVFLRRATILSLELIFSWRALTATPNDPRVRQKLINRLGSVLDLAEDIRSRCSKCPEDF